MVAVPMRPEYGPTLGRLLAPRWRAASPLTRAGVIALGVALLATIAGLGLTLENTTFSHGGKVPFSFSYRDLYRVAAEPGGYVRVQNHSSHGALEYSFAVNPLVLAPYSGELSAELPVYATGYIRGLSQRDQDFALRGEGKTRVNNLTGYEILYTTDVGGREMYGRDVLLLPERPGVREGVDIVMLTSATASSQVTSPIEVATTGVLLRPLRSFAFG